MRRSASRCGGDQPRDDGLDLGRREYRQQCAGDALVGARVAAVEPQLRRPVLSQPPRLAGEEAVVNRRAGDTAVGQCVAVGAQVGAALEPFEHAPHLRQQRLVVRVGAQAAQHLVQPPHRCCAA
jgi:hypothetical protein